MTSNFTPEQSATLEREEAAGRLVWLKSVLKSARGEQFLRPRRYRVSAKDFFGNAYIAKTARTQHHGTAKNEIKNTKSTLRKSTPAK